MQKRPLSLIIFILFISVQHLFAGEIRERFEKTYPLKSGGEFRLKNTNGRIEAEFPTDFSADISAHTTNGHVDCDFPMTVQGKIKRTSLQGRIGSASSSEVGRVTFRTTNGSIRIVRRL